ncbi:MAG: hypothetical protein ILO53_08700 [Clostridia bacterium]|nr:hypothetical protein [Clostridia bacterium]
MKESYDSFDLIRSGFSRDAAFYKIVADVIRAAESLDAGEGIELAFSGNARIQEIEASRQVCKVDITWVERIEEGLPHVQKAIDQARSLIKKEGDVVRIDRAKRFSRESVGYLARHSNAIKDVGDDGRVRPEEIYVTENDEEYAVYENRFLYFVLSLLKVFVGIRYNSIREAAAASRIRLVYDGYAENNGRQGGVRLELLERTVRRAGANNPDNEGILERIGEIMNTVDSMLATPLMIRVADAPKLTPPVVRTNVIKSNTSFSAVFEMYAFVDSYRDSGYEITDEERSLSEIGGITGKALKALSGLQLYAAYQGAFDGWADKEKLYETEKTYLQSASAREHRKFLDDMAALRDKCGSDGEFADVLIEKLREVTAELETVVEDRAGIQRKAGDAVFEKARLEAEAAKLRREAEEIRRDSGDRMRAALISLSQENNEKIEKITRKAEADMAEAVARWTETVNLLKARLRARGLCSDPTADIDPEMEREEFIGLEGEKEAFDRYFKRQWKLCKGKIRRDVKASFRKGRPSGAPQAGDPEDSRETEDPAVSKEAEKPVDSREVQETLQSPGLSQASETENHNGIRGEEGEKK